MAVRPEVVDYIAQQIKAGIKKDAIKKVLTENGWREDDIDEALSFFKGEGEETKKPPAQPVVQKPAEPAKVKPEIKQEVKPDPIVRQPSTIDAELQKEAGSLMGEVEAVKPKPVRQSASAQKISAMLDGANVEAQHDPKKVAEKSEINTQPAQPTVKPVQPLRSAVGDSDIVKFIKTQRAVGVSDKDIKKILKKEGGWNDGEIEKAMAYAVPAGVTATSTTNATTSSGKLPRIVTLLRDTWKVFTGRIWVLIGVAIIPVIVSVAFMFLFLVLGGSTLAGTLTSTYKNGFSISSAVIPLMATILAFIVLAFAHIWGTTALYHAVIGAGEEIGILEAYRRGWRYIGAYIWFSAIVSLVLIGSFSLAIIPGFIAGIWMSVALIVLIAEDERGVRAIIKSREYVRGNWWGVFARYSVLALFLFVIYGAIGLLGSFSVFHHGVIAGIISSLISVLVGAFVVSYSYVLYLELRAARGSFAFAPSAGKKVLYVLPVTLIAVGAIAGMAFAGVSFAHKGVNAVSPNDAVNPKSTQNDGLTVPDLNIGDELDGFDADLSIIDQPGNTATDSSAGVPGGKNGGDSAICNQVITRARNPKTGTTIDFPTPCDVPDGWERL